jgi:hypothetical protein
MRGSSWWVFLLVLAGGCSLLPTRSPGGGRCVDNSDCGTGTTCDPATLWCVCAGANCPKDGGAGAGGAGTAGSAGGAGGGAGTGGSAGVQGGAGGQATGGSVDAGRDVNPCNACSGKTPICLDQSCVECAVSSDCTAAATKPICDPTSHTCVPCTNDSQCAAKLGATGNPGVCRSELDGHCATDAETIYVQNSPATCVASYSPSGPGGTAAAPYCSMQPVALAASSTKTLVLIRGTVAAGDWTYQQPQPQTVTTFVGQQAANIASATTPGFNMVSGTAYVRNVTFGPSPSGTVCIQATGGTLNLDGVVVDSCKGGGIYLDGAAFDIENTTVTNNGPGSSGAITWGGILVNALPSTGPSTLNLDTVEMNKQVGVSCVKAITGTGVYATQNSGNVDVSGSCGFQTCSPMSATCGAQ